MRKISYEPKTKTNQQEVVEDMTDRVTITSSNEERYNALIENIDSVKPVGDTDCEYTIYLEDYAYTYIYQYASTDLTCEHSAAIIGECYPENSEIIICGIIPIRKDKLATSEEWINEDALEALQEEKEQYFPGTVVLGWLHMQPGYGTMLTMKEVKVHRDLFNREGSLLLLVDPVNRIETFYIYQEEELLEQTGYYIYYDKNASMQDYMLDKPLGEVQKDESDDSVVTQFREIGRMRKKEYQQKNKANLTVMAASALLLALTALVVQTGNQKKQLAEYEAQFENMVTKQTQSATQMESNKPTGVVVDGIETLETFSEQAESKTEVDAQMELGEQENTEALESIGTEESKDEPELEVIVVPKATEEEKEVLTEEKIEEPIEETPQEVTENEKDETVLEEASVETSDAKEKEEIALEDYQVYVVQEGDSLRSISYDHYQTESRTKDIIRLNDIENGDVIHVGEELKIPLE